MNGIDFKIFQDEYKDDPGKQKAAPEVASIDSKQPPLTDKESLPEGNASPSSLANLIDTNLLEADARIGGSGLNSDLAGLNVNCGVQPVAGAFMPSQLLQVS